MPSIDIEEYKKFSSLAGFYRLCAEQIFQLQSTYRSGSRDMGLDIRGSVGDVAMVGVGAQLFATAMEQMLKAICVANRVTYPTKGVKGHRLGEIFRQIPSIRRNQMETQWNRFNGDEILVFLDRIDGWKLYVARYGEANVAEFEEHIEAVVRIEGIFDDEVYSYGLVPYREAIPNMPGRPAVEGPVWHCPVCGTQSLRRFEGQEVQYICTYCHMATQTEG